MLHVCIVLLLYFTAGYSTGVTLHSRVFSHSVTSVFSFFWNFFLVLVLRDTFIRVLLTSFLGILAITSQIISRLKIAMRLSLFSFLIQLSTLRLKPPRSDHLAYPLSQSLNVQIPRHDLALA